VADWVRGKLPQFLGWNGSFVAIGYERSGVLVGGVVFTQYAHPNIVIACALEAPLTRRFLRGIFYYPFRQLGVRRVTALIDAKNTKSRQLVEHAGFVQEGLMRDAAPDDDVLIYGMTRSECRWL
jgi:RimJ/RimL family protein N-acetyltransferase